MSELKHAFVVIKCNYVTSRVDYCNVVLAESCTEIHHRQAAASYECCCPRHQQYTAPGADSIPAEVYKLGGMQLRHRLVDLFSLIWREEGVPQDFKDASIIHLYKRKGDHACCDNHRGI